MQISFRFANFIEDSYFIIINIRDHYCLNLVFTRIIIALNSNTYFHLNFIDLNLTAFMAVIIITIVITTTIASLMLIVVMHFTLLVIIK